MGGGGGAGDKGWGGNGRGDEPQGGHYSLAFLFFLSGAGLFLMSRDVPHWLVPGKPEIVASLGKWQEWSREAVHYCLCTGT